MAVITVTWEKPVICGRGHMRFLALILIVLSVHARQSCVLLEAERPTRSIDESFQHLSLSLDGYFGIYWNSSGDSASTDDHVLRTMAALSRARDMYHDLPGAWTVPLGPLGHYPVYLAPPPAAAPGATSVPWSENGIDGLSYMLLHPTMDGFDADPLLLLDVTAAHEFFHAWQFARGFAQPNLSFYEASAVWAEDQVFPDHDDWASRYLPALLDHLPGRLTESSATREYGLGALVKIYCPDVSGSDLVVDCLENAALELAWPRLLYSRADPEASLAAALAALLQAGRPGIQHPIAELAMVDGPNPAQFHALADVAQDPPWRLLDELEWQVLRVDEAGQVEAQPAGRSVWLLGDYELHALESGSPERVHFGDWLLCVNPLDASTTGPVMELSDWLPAGQDLLVWPNPGGRLRQIALRDADPGTLQLFGLDGRRIATLEASAEGRLLLPPLSTGTYLLKGENGSSTSITSSGN